MSSIKVKNGWDRIRAGDGGSWRVGSSCPSGSWSTCWLECSSVISFVCTTWSMLWGREGGRRREFLEVGDESGGDEVDFGRDIADGRDYMVIKASLLKV